MIHTKHSNSLYSHNNVASEPVRDRLHFVSKAIIFIFPEFSYVWRNLHNVWNFPITNIKYARSATSAHAKLWSIICLDKRYVLITLLRRSKFDVKEFFALNPNTSY